MIEFLYIFFFWIAPSFYIGKWGEKKAGISFKRGYFVSLFLSPVIGFIYVCNEKEKRKYEANNILHKKKKDDIDRFLDYFSK